MSHAQRMVETNPSDVTVDAAALVECIEACFDCSQACTACADACLGEEDIKMLTRCIRFNLDCADICDAIGKILSRQTASSLRWCVVPCRPAPKRVASAETSARTTLSTGWSTAVSVPRPAGAARAPATISSHSYALSAAPDGREITAE
jgi:hypothetical protein